MAPSRREPTRLRSDGSYLPGTCSSPRNGSGWGSLLKSPRRLGTALAGVLLVALLVMALVGGVSRLVQDDQRLAALAERVATLQAEIAHNEEMHSEGVR